MKNKTIFIKCEVSDDIDFDNTHYPRVEIREAPGGDVVEDDIECEIITTPTEEEIKAHYMAYSEKALDVINWYKQRLGL